MKSYSKDSIDIVQLLSKKILNTLKDGVIMALKMSKKIMEYEEKKYAAFSNIKESSDKKLLKKYIKYTILKENIKKSNKILKKINKK